MFQIESLDDCAVMNDTRIAPMLEELDRQLHGQVRELSLTEDGNQLVLRGRARTYYVKQLAQTVVLAFEDPSLVVNEIEVL